MEYKSIKKAEQLEKLDIIQVDPQIFDVIIQNVRKIDPLYEKNLSLKESYENHDCFLLEDGRGGFCVDKQTKELCNIFSIERNRGKELVTFATNTNSKLCLDCFDGYLKEFYGKHGFKETSREQNWTAGEPDIVYMSFDKLPLTNAQKEKVSKEILRKQDLNPHLNF